MSFITIIPESFDHILKNGLHTTCQIQLAQDFLFILQREEMISAGCKLVHDEVKNLIRNTTINGWFSPIHHDSIYCSPNTSSILYPGLSMMSLIIQYPLSMGIIFANNPFKLHEELFYDINCWAKKFLLYEFSDLSNRPSLKFNPDYRMLGMGDLVYHRSTLCRNTLEHYDRHIFTARDERFCMQWKSKLNEYQINTLDEPQCIDQIYISSKIPNFFSKKYDCECHEIWNEFTTDFI